MQKAMRYTKSINKLWVENAAGYLEPGFGFGIIMVINFKNLKIKSLQAGIISQKR